MQVKLFKRNGTYQDKDGKEKHFTNFYVECGDQMIAVTPTYFEGADGRDPTYVGRKMVLSSYAEELPEKEKKNDEGKSAEEKTQDKPKKPKMESVDVNDKDIPF